MDKGQTKSVGSVDVISHRDSKRTNGAGGTEKSIVASVKESEGGTSSRKSNGSDSYTSTSQKMGYSNKERPLSLSQRVGSQTKRLQQARATQRRRVIFLSVLALLLSVVVVGLVIWDATTSKKKLRPNTEKKIEGEKTKKKTAVHGALSDGWTGLGDSFIRPEPPREEIVPPPSKPTSGYMKYVKRGAVVAAIGAVVATCAAGYYYAGGKVAPAFSKLLGGGTVNNTLGNDTLSSEPNTTSNDTSDRQNEWPTITDTPIETDCPNLPGNTTLPTGKEQAELPLDPLSPDGMGNGPQERHGAGHDPVVMGQEDTTGGGKPDE